LSRGAGANSTKTADGPTRVRRRMWIRFTGASDRVVL
jgi:hypothetical protein